jgi:hypothetical protein
MLTSITAEMVTNDHLIALFAAHCECRPLDMWRAKYEHSHDCDTEILDDIKKAGGWIGVVTMAKQKALARCAEHWNRDLASDIYAPLLATAWTTYMDNRGPEVNGIGPLGIQE